jgi:hypothetical protein
VAALTAAGAVAAGCGGGKASPPQSLTGKAEQLVTRAEINRYATGTPEHAFLQWWRDVQYSNLTAFVAGFQPTVRQELQGDSNLRDAFEWFAGSVRAARPAINDAQRSGAIVTLYTTIIYRRPIGITRYVTSTRPQAFVLVRRAGKWKLQSDAFVQATLPKALRRVI